MTIDKWNEASFDWKKVSASAVALYDEDILIAIDTEPDEMNTTVNAIHVIPSFSKSKLSEQK